MRQALNAGLLGLLLAGLPGAATADWSNMQFEVFFGEPWYLSHPDFTNIGRFLEDEYDIAFDETQARPDWLPESTVKEIENYLQETARWLSAMGFERPKLEPLVQRDDGQWAYRVYLYDYDGAPARYRNGCFGGKVRRLIEVDLQPNGGDGNVINGQGRITDKGYQDLAHELFHAVQAAYPIFTDDCSLGDWIVEGTAQAVGDDAARVLRRIEPRNLSALGVRRYHEPLRVEDDPPCMESSADGLGCLGRNDGYWTASLWRYLGEMEALGGSWPPTSFTEPDYGYLHRFFGERLAGAPSEANELAWLDDNLAGAGGFNKSLDRTFSTFTTTFAAYPTTRLATAGGAAPNQERYFDLAFGGCPEITLNLDSSPVTLPVSLATVASACVRLATDIGVPLHVQVTAHPMGGSALPDLWVGTQAGLAVGQPLVVRVKDTDFAEWRFRLAPDPGEQVPLVISNVAGDAERTAEQQVELRFTASAWSRNLGSP